MSIKSGDETQKGLKSFKHINEKTRFDP